MIAKQNFTEHNFEKNKLPKYLKSFPLIHNTDNRNQYKLFYEVRIAALFSYDE